MSTCSVSAIPAMVTTVPAGKALFVYGTLLSGYIPKGADPVVPPPTLQKARNIGAAVLHGFELCDLGRYPCIVRGKDDEPKVHGELYELCEEADWPVLDAYEGIPEDDEYRREVSWKVVSVHRVTRNSNGR